MVGSNHRNRVLEALEELNGGGYEMMVTGMWRGENTKRRCGLKLFPITYGMFPKTTVNIYNLLWLA